MSNNTSVVVTVSTVVANTCDKCGASVKNPQHKLCAECFKKLPKKAPAPKPAAVAPTAPAPVAVTVTPVATPAPAVEAPKAETKPVVAPAPVAAPAARPAPERPAHITVKKCACGNSFVPRDPRHEKCPTCHKKVMDARRAEDAKRDAERKAEDERRASQKTLLTAYRNGTLPKDAKVRENGAQIVICINGVSTTLYDHEGFNARREAARYAETLKAKAAADKARVDAEKAAAAKVHHDRAAKALFQALQSGKALPPTITVKRSGVNVLFTVSVVGKAPVTYTAVDPDLAAAEDAARKAAESAAKAARKQSEKKGGKKGKAA